MRLLGLKQKQNHSYVITFSMASREEHSCQGKSHLPQLIQLSEPNPFFHHFSGDFLVRSAAPGYRAGLGVEVTFSTGMKGVKKPAST